MSSPFAAERRVGSALAAVGIAAMVLWWPAFAAAETTPRAAEHDGFGRMVFDWSGPQQWSAEVAGSQLVVHFQKPVAGDPKTLLKPLSHYVKGVTVSPDRLTLTFQLAVPVQAKSFVTGNSAVIDLAETKSAKSAPVTDLPAPPPPPVAKTAPAGPEAPTELMVRGGEHTGFNRLVFDWPKPVEYSVNLEAGKVVIAFDRPAHVNTTALAAALPTDVSVVEIRPAGKGTAVVLRLPADMRVRQFTSGSKVAVDLVRPAGAEPPRAVGTTPPPLAPAPGKDEVPAGPKPPPAPPPPAVATPALPAVAPAASGPEISLPSAPVATDNRLPGVAVAFTEPTMAAAFRRAGWLWLVFDKKLDVDPKELVRGSGGIVLHAEAVEAKNGTALRLVARSGFSPVPHKEGSLWVFDLIEQPLAPKTQLDVNKQFDFEDRGRVVITGAEAAKDKVVFKDPEVGDMLHVVPVATVGAGVRGGKQLPQAELIATAQGVALAPRGDGPWLDTKHGGIQVTMPGGLTMSKDVVIQAPTAQPAGGPVVPLAIPATGPLEIAKWTRGGVDKFEDEHQALLRQLSAAKPNERSPIRVELARHYLANAMAAEAIGVLRDAQTSDPGLADTANWRGVRGPADFMLNRDGDASDDLGHPSLAGNTQAALWLAAARARGPGDPARFAPALRGAAEEMKGWPPRLRLALGRVAINAMIQAGDAKGAAKVFEAINGPGFSKYDQGALSYLAGTVAEANKQFDQALVRYREAEDGPSRPDRAYAARARIELQLRRGQINNKEAIRQLEKLRFAWRGEDFEYRLIKRLTELLINDKQWGEGLRLQRLMVNNFGDNPDVGTISKAMSDTFNRLFLDGESQELQPVIAIGLYDEFQDLTPPGDKGDEMIRKLADRLASVDLLDRASDLLAHQVDSRLQGVEKARVGARLAFLQLSDRKASQALDTLDKSEVPNQPPDLYDQRRYMRVQTLADLGRTAEALGMILNDQSDDAKTLRAQIYWDMKRWPEAAVALEAQLGERPEGKKAIDPMLARKVLDLATALTLARDDRGLTRLRRNWGPLMQASEFKEAFALLTAEPERGIIDYRRVGEKIKQVEEFQTFMSEWKKRLQEKGLSSMN